MKLAPLIQPSSSLAERYRLGDAAVGGLYGPHPGQAAGWAKRAEWLDRSEGSRADRRRVAQALREYQSGLPAYPEAAESLNKLERADSLVVVGGQQAGLFGGALMIYYKALTVVQTAKYAEERLGRPVVPVFWIAGEDHDFDEANHVNVQSADGSVRRVRIERPEGARQAVSRTKLSAGDWQAALQELAAQLPDSEHKPALLERLQSHIADAPSLSLAFARLLADWFGKQGLVLLDADDPHLRALEGPMFRALIERNAELEAALKAGEARVKALGFPLQAETADGGANLFLHHEQGRLLLQREDGRFSDRRGHVSFTQGELAEWTVGCPDRLSTNALTRPLMQDYALPVLAAVLGPSELAYWGILGPSFAEFGMEMPILVPRQSFTYLEHNVVKLLDKYGLTVEEAIAEWPARRAEWLSLQDDGRLGEKFKETKEKFLELYAPLIEEVGRLQPGLGELAATNRDRIVDQIAFLEHRSSDAIAKKHEAALRQWDRIRQSLMPSDKPQERVYGTVHFLNRYGPKWLSGWREVPYEETGGHRLAEALAGK